MKKVAIAIAFSLTLMVGCKKENRQVETDSVEASKDISVEENLQLTLDNGEKWIANQETQLGVEKMDVILKKFKSSATTNYQELGNELSEQTSYIIKNCTMKGEPHEQLHVVLVPMLDEISILKESNDEAASIASIGKLEALIRDYFKHFKV